MVLFLCSDKAGFITGENICIDGGMTRQMIYHNDEGWTLELCGIRRLRTWKPSGAIFRRQPQPATPAPSAKEYGLWSHPVSKHQRETNAYTLFCKNGSACTTVNRWSSESRSQTCLDYAESRQRKTKSNLRQMPLSQRPERGDALCRIH